MIFRRLPLGVLVFLCVSFQAPAQTPLRWKWIQGEKLTYVVQYNDTTKSTADKDFFELSQALTLDTTWHVKNVTSSGEASIVVTVERVRFTAVGKGAAAAAKISFDSKDEKEPQNNPEKSVFQVLKSLGGSEISLAVSAQARVSRFDIPKALASKLDDQVARELAGFFGDLFTVEGLRHRLTNWLVALPNDPVAEHQSWQEEKLSRLGKPIACVNTYTFAERVERHGRRVMKLDVKPEFRMPASETEKERGKITEQDGNGVVYFDNLTGRITESAVTHRAVLQGFGTTTLDSNTVVKLATEPNK